MDAITRYLGVGSYAQWDEETRQSWLLTELQGKRPLLPRNVPLANLGFDEIVQVSCSVVVCLSRQSRQGGDAWMTVAGDEMDVDGLFDRVGVPACLPACSISGDRLPCICMRWLGGYCFFFIRRVLWTSFLFR